MSVLNVVDALVDQAVIKRFPEYIDGVKKLLEEEEREALPPLSHGISSAEHEAVTHVSAKYAVLRRVSRFYPAVKIRKVEHLIQTMDCYNLSVEVRNRLQMAIKWYKLCRKTAGFGPDDGGGPKNLYGRSSDYLDDFFLEYDRAYKELSAARTEARRLIVHRTGRRYWDPTRYLPPVLPSYPSSEHSVAPDPNPTNVLITVGNKDHVYDGSPKRVTVTTSPPDMKVKVFYNGEARPPTLPGIYPIYVEVAERGCRGQAHQIMCIDTTNSKSRGVLPIASLKDLVKQGQDLRKRLKGEQHVPVGDNLGS